MAHILVFDDDEMLREVLVGTLALDRHRVSVGHGGRPGLAPDLPADVDLVVTGSLAEQAAVLESIRALARDEQGVWVVALAGGRGLVSAGLSIESAAAMGITVILLKNFVRANLRQAVATALCH